MRVTIHQPEFAPWLGFFDKVGRAESLILLDDVQFRKNYFQNRNRLRTAKGWTWITVPVERSGLPTPINQIRIASRSNPRWPDKACRAIEQLYGQAPYFSVFFDELRQILEGPHELLVELNIPVLHCMLNGFSLDVEVLVSSQVGVPGRGSERILGLCTAVGATTYISGISGRDYLDLDSFQQAGIAVEFQDFHHPVYPQLHDGFVPCISALEALFLLGPKSPDLLGGAWPHRLAEVFK